ncbi:galactonate dehydratase [Halogeometricum borinquense]|uniref:Galactonate dehydratase n=1 Tax=Halogeometricum borinquense TaxID=60847 RepID=A0A6C0UJ83_9EURY|nr:galactonate dehydratase [Halogeometricum borinquense]QIB73909.1 galactonate dehydratase [Halogeometricum borinquense]
MQITDYELFEVPPRWLFLRIETDDGLVGWGEPIVEGRAKTVKTAVTEVMDGYLLGKDPQRIQDHWQAMYRGGFYRGGPVLMSAMAGIDQALWDIKGKRYDAPVYELLGGKARDKVRVYQWIGGDRPEDLIAEAEKLVNAGYTAIKMDATERTAHIDTPAAIDTIIERISGVRKEIGDEVDLCVDFRGRVAKPMAKQLLSELESVRPMFVEEPLLPEHSDQLANVAAHSTVPIATGERMYSRWDFKPLFEDGAVDVIQPNVSHAGGISEVRRIASMAEAYNVAVAPNCPLGPIALAASLQVSTATPNLLVQDQGFDIESGRRNNGSNYLAGSGFEFEDGYLLPTDQPGLGITPDRDTIAARAQDDTDWHNPIWRHPDGSVAEW